MRAERRKHYLALLGRAPRAEWQWAKERRQNHSSFTGTPQSPAPVVDLRQSHSEDPALTSQTHEFLKEVLPWQRARASWCWVTHWAWYWPGQALYPSCRWEHLLHPRSWWLKALKGTPPCPQNQAVGPYHHGLSSLPWDLRARQESHRKPERRHRRVFHLLFNHLIQEWNFRSHILLKPHRNKLWGGLCSLGPAEEGQVGGQRPEAPTPVELESLLCLFRKEFGEVVKFPGAFQTIWVHRSAMALTGDVAVNSIHLPEFRFCL